MKEIKFKAKLSHSKQWIVGNLIIAKNGQPYIIPSNIFEPDGHHLRIDSDEPYWVDKETICQFIGMLDANGVDIYDGDIVERFVGDYPSTTIVKWMPNKNGWRLRCDKRKRDLTGSIKYYVIPNVSCMKVLGNIFDNPELLKSKED